MFGPVAVAAAALLATGPFCSAQPLSITTFAGSGVRGQSNGPALQAQFAAPSGVAVDAATNVYVADAYSNVIRFIAADSTGSNWTVRTIAGLSGATGRVDGTNGGARFNGPLAVAVDSATNLYIADAGNNAIRQLHLDSTGTNWVAITIAGTNNGAAGSADGTNGAAQFNGPGGIALSAGGGLFIADKVNHTIRKAARDANGTNWVVVTFAGAAGSPGFSDAAGQFARFNFPNSLAVDAATNVYVADGGNNAVRLITPAGAVTTLAGGQAGSADGVGTNAQFNMPCGIAVDAATNVYVADLYNYEIRRLSRVAGTWVVQTVAGKPGIPGRTDGVASFARFQFFNARGNPNGLAMGPAGDLFIADSENNLIRRGTLYQGLLFTALPQNTAALVGDTINLSAAAVGAIPMTYQWLLNGAPVSGATNATLTLTNLLTNAAGSYSVIVSNSAGFTNSPPALVAALPPLAVWTIGGVGAIGTADGRGLAARFNNPRGLAVDPSGNLFIADTANETICQCSPIGQVTTLAGGPQAASSTDGIGAAARFSTPCGVSVDLYSNVYVADTANNTVRVISRTGAVTTLAGVPGSSGYGDGLSQTALFNQPFGVAVDRAGVVYVADTYNQRIRVISHGYVTTLAGDGSPGFLNNVGTNAEFSYPIALAVDSAGVVFVADYGSAIIRRIAPGGSVSTIAGAPGQFGAADGTNAAARFYLPSGIAVDAQDNLYAADYGNQTVRKITPDLSGNWAVTTLAGFPTAIGDSDGVGTAAYFHGPIGVAVDSAGYVYVSDSLNSVLRKITPAGAVSTIAGPARSFGVDDGPFPIGRFDGPGGVVADASGDVFAADTVNNAMREISPNGVVTTIAGIAGPDFGGASDGYGGAAQFNQPTGLALGLSSNIYVADFQNSTIRMMAFDSGVGQWHVTTVAGTAGNAGYANGANALFNGPWGVAVDGAGAVYVSDYSNHVVRVLTALGASNYAGSPHQAGYGDGANAFFNYPAGIALDSAANLYVADSLNQLIRKIAPGGVVSTVAGSYLTPGNADGNGLAAQFNYPEGLAVDAFGNVFVADTGNNAIREITPNGGVVTVAAGPGLTGGLDGVGAAAQFNGPAAIALASDGSLLVADTLNNTLRQAVGWFGQPIVLTAPFDVSAPVGAPVALAPVVAGAPPLGYRWLDNLSPVPNAANLVLTIPAVQPGDAGGYQLALTNALGADTGGVTSIFVTQPPQIYTQPGSQIAASNAAASFAVSAYGAAPLKYQWSFDGVAIQGATSATLTISQAHNTNAGTYQVVVSNTFGSVTSLVSELIVAAPPQILSGPSNQVAQCGGNPALTATVTGTSPIGYQWLAGGAPIPSATLPTLFASNLVAGQAQSFSVIVSNAFGAATSQVAVVNVVDIAGPVINILGASVTNILIGGAFTDPGATAYDLCSGPASVTTGGSVNTSVLGTYVLTYRATDANGNSSTNTRTVNVVPQAPVVVGQPGNHTNYPGAAQSLTVSVTGAAPMTFQWYKNNARLANNSRIAGATNQTLTIAPLTLGDAGSYFVAVTNSTGGTVSSNGVLTLGVAGSPVAVTGFNRDVIVERTASGGDTSPYAQVFDPTYAAPTFCFYEAGLNAINYYGGSPVNLGLVSSRSYVSAVDSATTFQLAPYTANNTLYMSSASPSGALPLVSPTNLNVLSILAASASGGGTGSWTIQFADGTISPAFSFNAPDWQGTTGGAVTHFGELYCGNYGQFYAVNYTTNFPSLYQTTINLADLGLNVKSIAALLFTKPSPGSSSVTGVFAISGTTGPVQAPFRINAAALVSGALTFSLQAALNQSYTIQQTTNPLPGSWRPLTNFIGAGASVQFTVPLTNRQQFFRVVEP